LWVEETENAPGSLAIRIERDTDAIGQISLPV
jgi:hypothetical protein